MKEKQPGVEGESEPPQRILSFSRSERRDAREAASNQDRYKYYNKALRDDYAHGDIYNRSEKDPQPWRVPDDMSEASHHKQIEESY